MGLFVFNDSFSFSLFGSNNYYNFWYCDLWKNRTTVILKIVPQIVLKTFLIMFIHNLFIH